jgi:SAM-dependent methyltransferase
MMQKWKQSPGLYGCERKDVGSQSIKIMDYENVYKKEFLESDPVRDWESVDRCKHLWQWAVDKIDVNPSDWFVLDVGTKDCQFPEWLIKEHVVGNAIGTEIAEDYLTFAHRKKRPIVYANVCDMPKRMYGKFDMVFSHHVLGLTPDYMKALDEMWNCVKPGGYMITLNDVPGNPKKHYSYINTPDIFNDFMNTKRIKLTSPELIYNNYWNDEYQKEWVFFMKMGEK